MDENSHLVSAEEMVGTTFEAGFRAKDQMVQALDDFNRAHSVDPDLNHLYTNVQTNPKESGIHTIGNHKTHSGK